MVFQETYKIQTQGRGTYDISGHVRNAVDQGRISTGLAHIFVHHTSASIILCENADPLVRRDLEAFAARFAPDGDPMFEHTDEGPDDMSSHIRTIFTQSELTIPMRDQRLLLGTWQGIYLWEHRTGSFSRSITVTLQGE